MNFRTDPNTLRVIDEDLGYSLERTSGGSDGRIGWALVGPGFRLVFDTYQRLREANPVERTARPDIDKTIVWQVYYHGEPAPPLSLPETYELIREGLLAERLSERDDEVNWAVAFNPIGTHLER